jgi:hypothetical protein
MGTDRQYMSSLNYCIQTKYRNKQTLLWNLCVLLTYIIQYYKLFKFYTATLVTPTFFTQPTRRLYVPEKCLFISIFGLDTIIQ